MTGVSSLPHTQPTVPPDHVVGVSGEFSCRLPGGEVLGSVAFDRVYEVPTPTPAELASYG